MSSAPCELFASPFEAHVSAFAKKHGARVHRQWIDGQNERDKTRLVRMYAEGSVMTVERNRGWEEHETERVSKRGRIGGFSDKSRKRFLLFVSSLRRDVLPLFITLTYPDRWPEEWSNWKDHLHKWWSHEVARKWPGASCVWKLEPQERGAPHFHLMVWGVPFMPHEWLARTWWKTVGSGEEGHLRAGTRVERARSFRGVMCYAGKQYLGKRVELPASWGNVGRFWGAMGRKHFPRSEVLEFRITVGASNKFRRLIRKVLAAKGQRWTGRNVQFYTQRFRQWARAMDWAEGRDWVRIDFTMNADAEEAADDTAF